MNILEEAKNVVRKSMQNLWEEKVVSQLPGWRPNSKMWRVSKTLTPHYRIGAINYSIQLCLDPITNVPKIVFQTGNSYGYYTFDDRGIDCLLQRAKLVERMYGRG